MKTAYSQSFKTVFLASIAFGGVAVIAACFSRDIDDRMNSEVARKLRDIGEGKHSDITEKEIAVAGESQT